MSAKPLKSDVLVIDDEQPIRRLLRFMLEESDYGVREAETGTLGLSEVARKRPDAIILDLGLPDMQGIDVLRRLREWNSSPVLILSVFAEEKDKVSALDAGADDYLTKPFGGGELRARLRVMLKRAHRPDEAEPVRFGSVEVDLAKRIVTKAGVAVKLTVREYGMLRMLSLNRGKVLTHEQILTELWGPYSKGQTQYLRIYMMRLRQKLEDDPDSPKHLVTESGVGYRLVE